MSTHRMVLRVLVMVAVLSLAIVPTASAAVCPGGPGPNCIELRIKTHPMFPPPPPPVPPWQLPYFTDGAITQPWPMPDQGVSLM